MEFPRFFQIISKIINKGSPRFFQITSKQDDEYPRFFKNSYFKNKILEFPEIFPHHFKNKTKDTRDFFKLLEKQNPSCPRDIFSNDFKNKTRGPRGSFELVQKNPKGPQESCKLF